MNKIFSLLVAAACLGVPAGFAQTVGTALVKNPPQVIGTVDGHLRQLGW